MKSIFFSLLNSETMQRMTSSQLNTEYALQIAANPLLRHQPKAHTHTHLYSALYLEDTFYEHVRERMTTLAMLPLKPLQPWAPKRSITTTAHRNQLLTRAFRKLRGRRPRTSLFPQYTNVENGVHCLNKTRVQVLRLRNLGLYREDERHHTLQAL